MKGNTEMRYLVLAILAACTTTTAAPSTHVEAKPDAGVPTPRNFVCERVAVANPNATCTPELTDAGEHHTHSARVTIDKNVVSCIVNDAQVGVVCGPLFVEVRPAESAAPEATKQTKPTKK